MLHCPICDTPYSDDQQKCVICEWDLRRVSVGDKTRKELLDWSKGIWQELTDLGCSNLKSVPVNEAPNYLRQRSERDQVQPKERNENIANSLSQAISYPTPKLVETYNQDSHSSAKNTIKVSETDQSFSDRIIGKSKTVTLETHNRGIYTILKEESIDYLVPSQFFRITDSNYQIFQALFECRNYHKGYSERFNLIRPAVVNTISANQQWQLQEQGVLEFI